MQEVVEHAEAGLLAARPGADDRQVAHEQADVADDPEQREQTRRRPRSAQPGPPLEERLGRHEPDRDDPRSAVQRPEGDVARNDAGRYAGGGERKG